VRLSSDEPVSKGQPLRAILRALEERIRQDLDGLLSELRPQSTKPLPRLLLRVGQALPLFFSPHARFILGQGNVHLQRLSQEGIAEPVEDRLGNPLMLPDQLWLVLYRHTREEAERRLNEVSALELEDVFYDWNTLEVQGNRIIGPVLLDRMVGACFDIYRRLVEHADREV